MIGEQAVFSWQGGYWRESAQVIQHEAGDRGACGAFVLCDLGCT